MNRQNVIFQVILLFSILLSSHHQTAGAADCTTASCSVGPWVVTPSYGFASDTVTGTDGSVITRWTSNSGSFLSLTANNPLTTNILEVMSFNNYNATVYNDYIVTDPVDVDDTSVNYGDFAPSVNEVYFTPLTVDAPIAMELYPSGFLLTANGAILDLSNPNLAVLTLTGHITIDNGRGDSHVFRMIGSMQVSIDISSQSPVPSITAFYLGNDSDQLTGIGGCQYSSTPLQVIVGNAALTSGEVCLQSDGLHLLGTIHLKSYHAPADETGVLLPTSSISISDTTTSGSISLGGGTMAVAEGINVAAQSIILRESAYPTVYADGGLVINSLGLPAWYATIDLNDYTVTDIWPNGVAYNPGGVPDKFQQDQFFTNFICPSGHWYGTFIGTSFCLGSNVYSETGAVYGFMVDTTLPATQDWFYLDLNNNIARSNSSTTFAIYNDTQFAIMSLAELAWSEKKYNFFEYTGEATDPAYSIYGTSDNGLPTLLVSDYGGNYDANYSTAITDLTAAGQNFITLPSCDTGTISIQADSYVTETSILDDNRYLYTQLLISSIPNIMVTGGIIPPPNPSASYPQPFETTFYSVPSSNGCNFELIHKNTNMQLNTGYTGETVETFPMKDLNTGDMYAEVYTLTSPSIRVSGSGLVKFLPPVTVTGLMGPNVQLANEVEWDMANKTMTIFAADDNSITLDSTVILTGGGRLETLLSPYTQGYSVAMKPFNFTGTFAMMSGQEQAFAFFGDGTYDIQAKQLSGISDIITPAYYLGLGYNHPAVFLGSIGLSSDGLNAGAYSYSYPTLTGGTSTYYYLTPSNTGLNYVRFDNVNMSVDVSTQQITSITSPTANPEITFTDPENVQVRVSATGPGATITTGTADSVTFSGDPITITDSSGSYELDGQLTVDYLRGEITAVQPAPGTGLVLNKYTAVFTDNTTGITDSGGVIYIPGNIDIGPGLLSNPCAATPSLCVSYNGSFDFNFDENTITAVSVTGSLKVPSHFGTGIYEFSSFTNSFPIQGSHFIEGTIPGGYQVVIDFNLKKIAAVRGPDNPTYLWATEDSYFTWDGTGFNIIGSHTLAASGQIPNNLSSDYIDDNSYATTDAGDSASITTAGTSLVTTKLNFGNYHITGTISTAVNASGSIYHVVTNPRIWVIRDLNNGGSGDDPYTPGDDALLYYEGTIHVGEVANTITSQGGTLYGVKITRNPFYDSNYPPTETSLTIADQPFTITSNSSQNSYTSKIENTLTFEGYDPGYKFLPELSGGSFCMVFAENGGDPIEFKLYKDYMTTQSPFSQMEGAFLSGYIQTVLALSMIDVQSDPLIVLSQKEGNSRAQQKFGIKDFIGKSWTTEGDQPPWYKLFLAKAGTNVPDDIFNVQLDHVAQEYGATFKVLPQFLPAWFGGKNKKEIDLWLTLGFAVDSLGDPRLDKISTKIKTATPWAIVPEAPAGFGMNTTTITVDGIQGLAEGTSDMSVTLSVAGPLTDPGIDYIIEELKKEYGLDLVKLTGSATAKFGNAPPFELTISGDAKLLNLISLGNFYVDMSLTSAVEELTMTSSQLIPPFLEGDFSASMILDLSANTLGITANDGVSLTIPHGIPFVGGKSFGGLDAYTEIITSLAGGLDKADVGMVIGIHLLFVHFDFDVGLELAPHLQLYAHRGDLGEFDMEDAFNYYIGPESEVPQPLALYRTTSSPLEVTLDGSQATPMLKLTGTGAAPRFDVIYPDGTRYNFDQCYQGAPEDTPFPDTLFFVVDEANNSTFAALNHPPAGTYQLIPSVDSEAGELSLAVVDPAPVIGGSLHTSPLTRADGDGTLGVDLSLEGVSDAEVTFYATAKRRFTGIPISATYQHVSSGTTSYALNVESDVLYSGYFNVYAKVRDRGRVPRFIWLDELVRIVNGTCPPIPETVTAVERPDGDVDVSWTEDPAAAGLSYRVHVFEAGEIDPMHSHYFSADTTEYIVRGLAPDKSYQVLVEAVGADNKKAYSHPVAVTTSADSLAAGSPDLEVDVARSVELTRQYGQLYLTVCNTGTADSTAGEIDIFYKEILPRNLIEDHPLGPVAAGSCEDIEVVVSEAQREYFKSLGDLEESVALTINKVTPVEYSKTNNFQHINFTEEIFPQRLGINGRVVGVAGSVVAGATVTLVDGEGNSVATTSTDGSGLFSFSEIIAGRDYTMSIEGAGLSVSTAITPMADEIVELGDVSVAPDLVVESLSGPDAARAGSVLGQYISLVIANRGLEGAVPSEGYFVVDLVLSTDPIIGNDDDVPLADGSYLVSETIGPESSLPVPLTGRNTIPESAVPGNYYLGVTVDAGVSRVEESDETNNSSILPMAITEQFELLQYLPGFLQ